MKTVQLIQAAVNNYNVYKDWFSEEKQIKDYIPVDSKE